MKYKTGEDPQIDDHIEYVGTAKNIPPRMALQVIGSYGYGIRICPVFRQEDEIFNKLASGSTTGLWNPCDFKLYKRDKKLINTSPDDLDSLKKLNDLTFKELRIANKARSYVFKQNESGGEWTLNDWATALAGEVGEACNLLKKIRRGDYDLSLIREDLADELADVQIYLDLLADAAGIDLANATKRKFNAVSRKRDSNIKL